ncbi:MAG: glucosamine-6-phosphate deaminase [Oceanospirillales bacterium LUC14_002_19_P2]|nr:MAG: glucosamine-6-phosphate deaminase [Oceanospirillales bacterium LUC14_002_19_P2]
MRLIPLRDSQTAGLWSARYIADRIRAFNPGPDRPFVLGLPTGSTPLMTYRELIQLHQQEGLSFRHVITFNMDEYVGLDAGHAQSYRTFMEENLFRHIDIPAANIHFLDGNANDLDAECQRYEDCISAVGGIHLFFGGVGHDGHIAFNEPGSSLRSRTRIKTLALNTRQANARFFEDDIDLVPRLALTVGVGTIMDADEVLILATGSGKARAVKAAVEDPINHMWTISALQLHPKTLLVCDDAATLDLTVRTLRYFESIEAEHIQGF